MRSEELLNPRDAARALGISYPTLKQWIYKKKLRSVQTAGGHPAFPRRKSSATCRAPRKRTSLPGAAAFAGSAGAISLSGAS